jgi:hypothetical protein
VQEIGQFGSLLFHFSWSKKLLVQQRKLKPNDERFDLSIKEESVKPPIIKNATSDSCEIRF